MGQLTAWTFDTKRDWLIVVVLHARNPLLLAKMPQKLLSLGHSSIFWRTHTFVALPAVSHHHRTNRNRWRIFQRLSERSFCGLHQQRHQQQYQLHCCRHEPVFEQDIRRGIRPCGCIQCLFLFERQRKQPVCCFDQHKLR